MSDKKINHHKTSLFKVKDESRFKSMNFNRSTRNFESIKAWEGTTKSNLNRDDKFGSSKSLVHLSQEKSNKHNIYSKFKQNIKTYSLAYKNKIKGNEINFGFLKDLLETNKIRKLKKEKNYENSEYLGLKIFETLKELLDQRRLKESKVKELLKEISSLKNDKKTEDLIDKNQNPNENYYSEFFDNDQFSYQSLDEEILLSEEKSADKLNLNEEEINSSDEEMKKIKEKKKKKKKIKEKNEIINIENEEKEYIPQPIIVEVPKVEKEQEKANDNSRIQSKSNSKKSKKGNKRNNKINDEDNNISSENDGESNDEIKNNLNHEIPVSYMMSSNQKSKLMTSFRKNSSLLSILHEAKLDYSFNEVDQDKMDLMIDLKNIISVNDDHKKLSIYERKNYVKEKYSLRILDKKISNNEVFENNLNELLDKNKNTLIRRRLGKKQELDKISNHFMNFKKIEKENIDYFKESDRIVSELGRSNIFKVCLLDKFNKIVQIKKKQIVTDQEDNKTNNFEIVNDLKKYNNNDENLQIEFNRINKMIENIKKNHEKAQVNLGKIIATYLLKLQKFMDLYSILHFKKEIVYNFSKKLNFIKIKKGEFLYRQGETAKHIFILLKGELSPTNFKGKSSFLLNIIDSYKYRKLNAINFSPLFSVGSILGFQSFVGINQKRDNNIIAQTDSIVATLSSKYVNPILSNFEESIKDLQYFLSYSLNMSNGTIRSLYKLGHFMSLDAGKNIYIEGSIAKFFVILIEGEVCLTKNMNLKMNKNENDKEIDDPLKKITNTHSNNNLNISKKLAKSSKSNNKDIKEEEEKNNNDFTLKVNKPPIEEEINKPVQIFNKNLKKIKNDEYEYNDYNNSKVMHFTSGSLLGLEAIMRIIYMKETTYQQQIGDEPEVKNYFPKELFLFQNNLVVKKKAKVLLIYINNNINYEIYNELKRIYYPSYNKLFMEITKRNINVKSAFYKIQVNYNNNLKLNIQALKSDKVNSDQIEERTSFYVQKYLKDKKLNKILSLNPNGKCNLFKNDEEISKVSDFLIGGNKFTTPKMFIKRRQNKNSSIPIKSTTQNFFNENLNISNSLNNKSSLPNNGEIQFNYNKKKQFDQMVRKNNMLAAEMAQVSATGTIPLKINIFGKDNLINLEYNGKFLYNQFSKEKIPEDKKIIKETVVQKQNSNLKLQSIKMDSNLVLKDFNLEREKDLNSNNKTNNIFKEFTKRTLSIMKDKNPLRKLNNINKSPLFRKIDIQYPEGEENSNNTTNYFKKIKRNQTKNESNSLNKSINSNEFSSNNKTETSEITSASIKKEQKETKKSKTLNFLKLDNKLSICLDKMKISNDMNYIYKPYDSYLKKTMDFKKLSLVDNSKLIKIEEKLNLSKSSKFIDNKNNDFNSTILSSNSNKFNSNNSKDFKEIFNTTNRFTKDSFYSKMNRKKIQLEKQQDIKKHLELDQIDYKVFMLGFEKNNLKVSETKLKSVVNLAPNVKIQNKSKNIKTKPNVIIKLKNSSEQLIQCDSGRFNMPMLSSNLDFLSSFNSKN